MSFMSRIKARLLSSVDTDEMAEGIKKQYNVVIDKELIAEIRYLASKCDSNRSATAEHMLEIGAFYLARALENPQKREIVVNHICDKHLLGIIHGADDPAVLLLGEKGDYWQLLGCSKHVLRAYKKYCQAPKMTMKTGDVRYIERAEKDLLKVAVGFAIWLQKRALGVPGDEGNDQGR